MYTRKPKDMTKFLVGITSGQAFHTWEYADKTRANQIGSSAILSDAARKKRETERSTIGEYRTSKVASIATHARREVVQHTRHERQKITARLERADPHNQAKAPPPQPVPSERPTPNATLYRRPLI